MTVGASTCVRSTTARFDHRLQAAVAARRQPVRLYFVVPTDIYSSFREQPYWNADKKVLKKGVSSADASDLEIHQYVLEIPLTSLWRQQRLRRRLLVQLPGRTAARLLAQRPLLARGLASLSNDDAAANSTAMLAHAERSGGRDLNSFRLQFVRTSTEITSTTILRLPPPSDRTCTASPCTL